MGAERRPKYGTPARFLDVLAGSTMNTHQRVYAVTLAAGVWPGTNWIEELRAAAERQERTNGDHDSMRRLARRMAPDLLGL